MEEKGSSSSNSSSSSSRWNPTKEQITLLEGLYKQGIRTPTAEQIQQITAKLREYGEIEGKNVFYWFQNHKARQRQKMKQEGIAYYTRMLARGPPLNGAPVAGHGPHSQGCGNAMCAPYCLPVLPPPGGVGYYSHPQYPNMFIPATGPQTGPTNLVGPNQHHLHCPHRMRPQPAGPYLVSHPKNAANYSDNVHNIDHASSLTIETLELFPLHPTATSDAERSSGLSASASHSFEGREQGEEGGDNSSKPPFYNFFG